jgi:hypothetical protein
VHPSERLALNEAFEPFDPQRELAQRQGALSRAQFGGTAPTGKPWKGLGPGVLLISLPNA